MTGYHPGRRGDIEGLRAVAVLTVLGFHASVPFFGGGFVGVDVFFVISGFLITGLLLADISTAGGFSLKEFYARRARRILPAAGVVLVVVALLSWLLLPPLRAKDVAYDVLFGALNLANWRFVANQTDYLAAARDHSPVLHFWSLGVEEQFYLVWAPLLLGLAVLARKLGRPAVPVIAGVIGLLTVGSFLLSVRWTASSEPLAYLGSPTRAWEFGLGALAAIALPWLRLPGLARWVLGLLGAGAIGAATVLFSSATAFPGSAALLPVLGTVAVIMAQGNGIGGFLSTRPMRAMGRLSFSWYLWHWPVLVFAEAVAGELAWPVKLALVLAAAGPAWLTARLVERPVRFSPTISALPVRGLAIGVTAVLLPVAAGLVTGSAAQRMMGGGITELAATLPLAAADGPDLLTGPAPGLTPPVDLARADVPPVPGCELFPAELTGPECLFGDPAAPQVLLIGDSHASQWFPAIRQLAERRGWAVRVRVKQGCPLPELTVYNPTLGRAYTECDTWRKDTLDQVAGTRPKLVFLASLNQYTADQELLAAAWQRSLDRLAATGAPLVYLRDTPLPGKDIPACVSADPTACDFPRSQALRPDPLVNRAGLSTVDMNAVLCPGESCPAVRQGVLLYRDDSHLTATAVALLGRRVEKTLQRQGLLPPVWQQVFREDFDGPEGSAPDPQRWQHATGTCHPGCPAPQWGTGEIETMTDSTDNVRHNGKGQLAITPIRANGQWTSGRLESRRTDFRAPAGGLLRVEAVLKLPEVGKADGAGYWPAFWLLGDGVRRDNTGWPGVGEIDVLESVNGRESVFGTFHCGAMPGGPCQEPMGLGSGETPCVDCQRDFHRYAIELDQAKGEIRWYLDGRQTFAITRDRVGEPAWRQATDHGFFLILNVAIGGRLAGDPNAATASGRPMLIDSVTVATG
ncbi:SGNH hydrolase domain-containing protein [Crossiella cryophila]|uniref:Peptidoglycan/LPS O-acetylase OafA/YrhL/beta-glucanase (GH16 family) n=1 Tax=Crossiella cryophila TaxID=43355 RepID=A0A7W7C6D1_9PSEU|nr:SGNH hydrolase domain-containing protein [Crossiella cryophila]MBB4675358.1 peptidoglycan/LPS O-acetylase OafA/YrhL/beta-glucanase (GH16 family) [Crossiella cryophila]